ncbi:MAG: hypothetical protein ACYTEZ_02230 [Planctomycetota bacterium]|jgi:hypothetical protein
MTLRSLFLALGAALALGMAVGELTAGDTDVFFEEEPNDAIPQVLDMGLGAQPGDPVRFRIKGRIDNTDDVDRFALDLNAGDVVGARATDTGGLDPRLRLEDADADLVIGNDDKLFGLRQKWLGPPLPLPDEGWGGDAILYVVIAAAGEYVLEVGGEDGTTGRYRLDLVVARPGLEAHPVGTRQILFVDFDGAKVHDMAKFGLGSSGTKTLSPLADFLVHWGLTAADEDAVIDAVLATIRENLYTEIVAGGKNGDYATSGTPGEFGIEIRNSRDHADTYGIDPLVTRLIIGGTEAEAGVGVWAFASTTDPGNFSTDDDAIVLLDRFAGLTPTPPGQNLNAIPIEAGHTKIELIGRALGNIGSHELGHTFGCWHTEWNNLVVDMMDQGGPLGLVGFGAAAVGPDGIFGTSDDFNKAFGVDAFVLWNKIGGPGLYQGVNDTLNTISFGLATGRK